MFSWYLQFSWRDSIPILLFSSISLHWSPRKAFLSLLAILWNSAFKWVYLSFSPLPLASLLFSVIYTASSDNHFAFLHFFFLAMVLITASCIMSQTSIRSSSGTLSIRSNPLNLFVISTIYFLCTKAKKMPINNPTKDSGLVQGHHWKKADTVFKSSRANGFWLKIHPSHVSEPRYQNT